MLEDPGRTEGLTGALVEAQFGRGRWIDVGLGCQLPAGTDGACQLPANLRSPGRAAGSR